MNFLKAIRKVVVAWLWKREAKKFKNFQPTYFLVEQPLCGYGPMREGGVAYCHYCGTHLKVNEIRHEEPPQPINKKFRNVSRAACRGACKNKRGRWL